MNKQIIVALAGLFAGGTAFAGGVNVNLDLDKGTLGNINKIEGNIATGNLENTSINATAIAVGKNSHAAAGGVINHNTKGGVINSKQRAEVDLSGATVNARAEAANGKKAFAGVYVNR